MTVEEINELVPPNINGSKAHRGVWLKGFAARRRKELKGRCPYKSRYASLWQAGWEKAEAWIRFGNLSEF